ncbi:MAG: helix-hairpin-helix domain-containing protein [Candidatus Cloacimonetes bacterium]|nr:helix-hairpin-helix domain-containing protein [Candidatus Cloacimonadota bacterium]
MKKIITFLIFIVFIFSFLFSEKIDLNQATYGQLIQLPLTSQQIEDIYNYRLYTSFFYSIYQLREIPSIDQKTLNKLKPLVRISHYEEKNEADKRRDEIYYLIQRLGSNEGFQEGMSDIWEDYLITPRNVNKMNYSDILSMPNVSPIDASSILIRKAGGDTLTSYRDLRKTPGISHYGASNLRHYVYYKEKERQNKLFVDYQMKYNDSNYTDEAQEMYKLTRSETLMKIASFWGYFQMDKYSPEIMNKYRIRYDTQWKAGIMFHTRKGEKNFLDKKTTDEFKDAKYFAGYENYLFGENFLKVYVGNFRATYGEGLVMENTDFSGARKTGHGFSKRVTGIIGDISRTQEYALKGTAIEWKNPKFQGAFFFSKDKKDAILYDSNQDGIINDEDDAFSYITLTRRFTDDELEGVESFLGGEGVFTFVPRLDALEEQIMGGHIEYSPFIGTHIGFTGYEAVYDRDIVVPNKSTLLDTFHFVAEGDTDKFELMDNEILAMYSTKTDEYDRNFRRVVGVDWQTVIGNTSFQGEYAELFVNGSQYKIGDDPHALILSSYSQFTDLYILALYRDYDLAFDNPYSTAFYEHEKFDDSVYDKNSHIMNNPLLKDIYTNSERAQAEKGIYFETRYRFNRYFTINRTYLDIWERKADRRKTVRFQGELDFRPIHQLSMRLKYKNQHNRYHDDAERGVSITSETTIKVATNLSARDRISLEYRYNKVKMPPYPYLANDAEIPNDNDTSVVGTTLIHGDYIGADWIHNFNENLKVQGSFIYWDGHGISHWDWEDMEIDFMGEQGNKYWFAIHSKIASNIYIHLKFKVKHYRTKELVWRTWWNSSQEDENDYDEELTYFDTVEKKENTIRLQIDWKF